MVHLELQDSLQKYESEECSERIELLTLRRGSIAESLAQYMLKRQTTLQIVVIRCRNLSTEFIRMYALAPCSCPWSFSAIE